MNVGLLDARGTGATFNSLRRGFTPVELFDLCSIIEEIVLRERLVLVGKFQKIPTAFQAELQPFIQADVFQLNVQSTRLVHLPGVTGTLKELALQSRRDGQFTSTLEDAAFEVTRLLGAEIDLNIPTTPLLRHLTHFGVRRPHLDAAVCNLRSQYGQIVDRLEDLSWRQSQNTGVRYISIPPIGYECLKRAGSFEQLPDRILEMRDDYKQLRIKMIELSEIMSDPTLSLERYANLVTSWERKWESVTHSATSGVLGIGLSEIALLRNGAEITSMLYNQDYRKLVKPVFELVRAGLEVRQSRLFRPLHTSVRNYLRASRTDMANAVSKIFDVSPRDAVRRMQAVSCANTSLWRAACRNITQARDT